MFWLFVQYLWYLLAAVALGVLVGWLWWGRRSTRPASPSHTKGGPDDLAEIEGIGPDMAEALRAAGISTFARLSASTEAQLRAAVGAAGLTFAPSVPTWAQQAGYLARGERAEFRAYVEGLVAGRAPGTPR